VASAAPPAGRWLYGPTVDLLLGCGVLYGLLLLTFVVEGPALRAAQSDRLLPFLVFLVSLPHYGATLVRVYEQRQERRRYAFFSVYTTLALVLLFVVGTRSTAVGSLLLTVYLTWSPWHYSGQNYGLAVMFLRRRGVDLPPGVKRLLYASFVLSYAIVFLAFHADRGGGFVLYNETAYAGSSIESIPLGIPRPVARIAFGAAGAAYLACLVAVGAALLRRAAPRDLVPAAALVLTQFLWFTLPFGVASLGLRTGLEPIDAYQSIDDYVFWVAIAHGSQYLWVTSYYARGSQGWRGYLRYLGKTLAAGVAIWTLPAFLFSPDRLGTPSSLGDVSLLAASVVNLHHFILDGAIWKLRDGRIAGILLRAPVPEAEAGGAVARAPWLRRGLGVALGLWLVLRLAAMLEYQVVARPATQPLDPERLRASAARLRWLGQDDPEIHFRLGQESGSRGDLATARRDFERSLLLQGTGRAWIGLSFVEIEEGDAAGARQAVTRAVETEPGDPMVWERAADVLLALGDAPRARDALARALELSPGRADLEARLASLAAASPDPVASP